MKRLNNLILASFFGAALLVSSCATAPKADDAALAVLRSTCNKLKAAQTLCATGTRVSDPSLLPAGLGKENASFEVMVVRPAKIAFKVSDGNGTRRILADGQHLTLVDDKANIYDTLPGKAKTIDAVAGEIEKTFDYQPIGLELLGSDPMKTLLEGVTSGKVVGDETVGGVKCRRLSFTQPGLNWDLWVSTGDQLPRKLAMVFTDRPGQPQRTVTINQWTLNSVVPASGFVFTPGKDAHKVDIIPAR
ncbi:MAG: DUF2092 domain-containing protein [Verrucomicrobiaceae bacterium]